MDPAAASTTPAGERSAVAIVGSAGAIAALKAVLGALPSGFPFPIVVAQHLPPAVPSMLPKILGWRSALPVKWAEPAEVPVGGVVYVVPPGSALALLPRGFAITPLAAFSRAWLDCPDRLLESMADRYGAGAVGIVLSGTMPVGIGGLRAIRRRGGIAIAQDRASSSFFDMPAGAIDLGKADIVLPPPKIAEALLVLAGAVARAA